MVRHTRLVVTNSLGYAILPSSLFDCRAQILLRAAFHILWAGIVLLAQRISSGEVCLVLALLLPVHVFTDLLRQDLRLFSQTFTMTGMRNDQNLAPGIETLCERLSCDPVYFLLPHAKVRLPHTAGSTGTPQPFWQAFTIRTTFSARRRPSCFAMLIPNSSP